MEIQQPEMLPPMLGFTLGRNILVKATKKNIFSNCVETKKLACLVPFCPACLSSEVLLNSSLLHLRLLLDWIDLLLLLFELNTHASGHHLVLDNGGRNCR